MAQIKSSAFMVNKWLTQLCVLHLLGSNHGQICGESSHSRANADLSIKAACAVVTARL